MLDMVVSSDSVEGFFATNKLSPCCLTFPTQSKAVCRWGQGCRKGVVHWAGTNPRNIQMQPIVQH